MAKHWKTTKKNVPAKTTEDKLSHLFNKHARDTSPFVHLAIDVQKFFSRGEEKGLIAHNIGDVIAPVFNKLSIPTYWVYYRDWSEQFMDEKFCRIGPFDAYDGLHDSIQPAANDRFVRKHSDSAFSGSNIHELLQEDQKNVLLVSGFNYHACVHDTVIDAKKHGYDVILLQDCTNLNGYSECEKEMKKHDVIHAKSTEIFERFKL